MTEHVDTTTGQAIQVAIAYHQGGQFVVAEQIYRQVLVVEPTNTDAAHLLGVVCLQTHRPDEAEPLIAKALAAHPESADVRFNYGLALQGLGRLQDAAAEFRRTLTLRPDFADAAFNLGNALRDLALPHEATEAYRRSVAINPRNAAALNNLGQLAEKEGKLGEADDYYQAALAANSTFADALVNLGNRRLAEERPAEAVTLYKHALDSNPSLVEAHFNLAIAYRGLGRADEAAKHFESAAHLGSDQPESHIAFGLSLFAQGKFDQAIERLRKAIRLDPGSAKAWLNMGAALQLSGRHDEAIESFQKALQLWPDIPECYNNLGIIYRERGLFDRAEEHLRKALEIAPDNASAANNLANLYKDQAKIEQALQYYRRALDLSPYFTDAASNYLLTYNYLDEANETLFDEHKVFGRSMEPLTAAAALHLNTPNPDRQLRIGYVSADFKRHSVSWFLRPLLQHYNREHYAVFCYANVATPDSMTEELKGLTDGWRSIYGVSDQDAEAMIRNDEIDILVDLAGHTGYNRLPLFARRPAPVQTSYLGYPNTTGMQAMDWRLTDAIADPQGVGDEFYTERLWRLPSNFLCYSPSVADAPIAPPPCLENGFVTFGSFNLLAKLSPTSISLWSKLLAVAPNTKLLLKNYGADQQATKVWLTRQFATHGIGEDRLILMNRTPGMDKHLTLYGLMDIALDTYPYHGTTTTFEALWQGVPVVTLRGDRHASRVGASILTHLGKPEWIGSDDDDYIRIARDLAADPTRLGVLRFGATSLRQQLYDSPLMDGPRLAGEIDTAFRGMWQDWCSRQA